MAIDPRELFKSFNRAPAEAELAPLAGTRAEKVQRLQVGMFGLICMVLVVALADIVVSRADQTEASVVSEQRPTVSKAEPSAPSDPLADAGVMPALPVDTGLPNSAANNRPTPANNSALPAGVAAQ